MAELSNRARDAVFRRLGVDAVHWPLGAAAGPTVRLILEVDRPEIPAGFGRVVPDRVLGEVRIAELPDVAAGDWLVAGGIPYKIAPNPERLPIGVWRLALLRQAGGP